MTHETMLQVAANCKFYPMKDLFNEVPCLFIHEKLDKTLNGTAFYINKDSEVVVEAYDTIRNRYVIIDGYVEAKDVERFTTIVKDTVIPKLPGIPAMDDVFKAWVAAAVARAKENHCIVEA